MAERLKVAREHGDIRENAEYDAAKDAQGLMESQIRRLKEALRDPEIIEAPVAADKRRARTCSSRSVRSTMTTRKTYLLGGARRGEGARCSDRDHVVSVGSRRWWERRRTRRSLVKAPGGSFKYIVVGFEPFVG